MPHLMSYPEIHVVLICFAINDPNTLHAVMDKWIHEVLHFCWGTPIILVGTIKELRNDASVIEDLLKSEQHPVTTSEGEELCKEIGAQRYMECSLKAHEGVEEIFEVAAEVSLIEGTRQWRKTWKKKHREDGRAKIRKLFSSFMSALD